MAEGWTNHLMGDRFEARSAGIDAGGLNPLVVKIMAEAGIDIARNRSKTIGDLSEMNFDFVVTLCGEARQHLSAFAERTKIVHVPFDAPPEAAAKARTEEEALDQYRRIRDEIRSFVETLPAALGHDDR